MLTSISLEVYIFQPFIRRGLPNAVKRSRQKYHSSLPGSSPLLPVTARITCSRSQMRLCYSWRFLRVRTRTGMSLYYTILFSKYANSLLVQPCPNSVCIACFTARINGRTGKSWKEYTMQNIVEPWTNAHALAFSEWSPQKAGAWTLMIIRQLCFTLSLEYS